MSIDFLCIINLILCWANIELKKNWVGGMSKYPVYAIDAVIAFIAIFMFGMARYWF